MVVKSGELQRKYLVTCIVGIEDFGALKTRIKDLNGEVIGTKKMPLMAVAARRKG